MLRIILYYKKSYNFKLTEAHRGQETTEARRGHPPASAVPEDSPAPAPALAMASAQAQETAEATRQEDHQATASAGASQAEATAAHQAA